MKTDNTAIFEAYLEAAVHDMDERHGLDHWVDSDGDAQPYSDDISKNPRKRQNAATRSFNYVIDREDHEYPICHREDGPAIIRPNGDIVWCLNHQSYRDVKTWAEDVLISQKKPHDSKSVEEFLRPILAAQTQDLI